MTSGLGGAKMSLQWQLSREVPEDTAHIGRQLFPQDNLYRQIGDRFNDLFPDEGVFVSLYAETGRGAIPPLLMALVTVFQMLEKVPDRVAADWVVSRLDWKYALHLPMTYPGFHFTDLSAFRQRLLAHHQERQVFDLVISRLKKLGLFKPQGKMRTDSTHLLGVVQRLSQLELVTESMRVALGVITAAAPEWVSQALPAVFVERYGRRQREYGLSADEVRQVLGQAGSDGQWLLAQVDQAALVVLRQLPEVEVLRTVLSQQFPADSGGAPAAKRPTGQQVIESPHEPEARYGTKRGQDWTGYKAQITETCDEDYPHLIVDLEVTGALANDSPELPKIQARLQDQQTMPGEQQVDQGYMSGQNLVASAALGINLMGMPLADTQGPPGFRQADFQIDAEARQATCPAGQTSVVWGERQKAGYSAPFIQVRFGAQTCQCCPFFD